MRLLLCTINNSVPTFIVVFFANTMFFSSLWRSFLIIHAQGFILNGQLNLKLFRQLYWIITTIFIFNGCNGDQPMYLSGKFPEDLVRGKICLLMPINNERERKKHQTVIFGVLITFGFIATVYVLYLAVRSKRAIKTQCTGKSMSFMGSYRRNMINFRETTIWSIVWCINCIFYPVYIELMEGLDLSPRTAFFIDTFYYVFLLQINSLSLVFILSSRHMPNGGKGTPKPSQFYVQAPLVLTPRRPAQPLSSLPFQTPFIFRPSFKETPKSCQLYLETPLLLNPIETSQSNPSQPNPSLPCQSSLPSQPSLPCQTTLMVIPGTPREGSRQGQGRGKHMFSYHLGMNSQVRSISSYGQVKQCTLTAVE